MKTEGGSQLSLIVPVLVLALLSNQFVFGLPQESASTPVAKAQSDNGQNSDSRTPPPPTAADKIDNGKGQNAPAAPVATQSDPASPDQLPDSPGSVQSSSVQSGSVQSGSVESAQLAPTPQPTQAQPQPSPRPREPLGTAVAETVPTMGVAASQPAGAALAPAKQRRVRTILITMGAILGAGAAVGATMALSEGSPSKPPGAH